MSIVTQWEENYRNAYPRGMERLAELKGVACAFHSVIDGCIHLTPEKLLPVLQQDPSFVAAAVMGCTGEPPEEIITPQDFIIGLFHSLYRGTALQRMIRMKPTYEWVLRTFGSGELRLGGTSANMARALAPLGIPVTIYANPLTVELAELFGDFDNLRVIRGRKEGFGLETPRQAAEERGIFAIHWIFEFGADFQMEIEGIQVRPQRANRYIPSWNPRNNQFKLDPVFAEGLLQLVDRYQYLLFSGFHILSETYLDGSTCEDVIRPLGEYLERVQEASPQLITHLELASIGSLKVRRAVLEQIARQVYSAGLNETELPLMLRALDEELPQRLLGDQPDAQAYARACRYLMKQTGLRRVHFHNFGYYLCLEREPLHTPADSRDALLFAAIMAAARAQHGLFRTREDIRRGLDTPVGEVGLQQLTQLAEALQQPGLLSEGIGELDGVTLTAVPTKVVERPLFTVGLGDTISSGALLTE